LASDKSLYDSAGIDRKTFLAYEQLLQNLLVLDVMPAWSTNRLARLARSPKRYLVDPSLATAALRLDVNGVLRDSDMLGRLIDTFAAAQLRPEVALSTSRPRLFHLRQEDGRREVDLIAELGGQDILAIEVKAGAAPSAHDARHLSWLRDSLGERFLAGAVLHTGPRPYQISERIFAVPLACLWEASPGHRMQGDLD
jgi:predicted AAA+ superfamily ATPase